MATTQQQVEEGVDTGQLGLGEKHRSLKADVWRQFRRHKGALAGLILLTIIVIATVFGPLIYPADPFEIDVASANQTPSVDHLMGTDNLGRDVLARILIGGRISLSVGFAAMIFGVIIGHFGCDDVATDGDCRRSDIIFREGLAVNVLKGHFFNHQINRFSFSQLRFQIVHHPRLNHTGTDASQ